MRLLMLCACLALALAGCAESSYRQPTLYSASIRVAQINFKHAMLAILQGAKGEAEDALRADPRVEDVTVVLDYELPRKVDAQAMARVPVIVVITWKGNVDSSKIDAGGIVCECFKRRLIDQPTITNVVSNGNKVLVEGFLLTRSVPQEVATRKEVTSACDIGKVSIVNVGFGDEVHCPSSVWP